MCIFVGGTLSHILSGFFIKSASMSFISQFSMTNLLASLKVGILICPVRLFLILETLKI